MVAANLTSADYDIPAATGFVLVHKPINPASATGGGYFQVVGSAQTVNWDYPPMNGADWLQGFDFQVGLATTAFTDTSPAPVYVQNDGSLAHEFTGLTAGSLYRWRVRAVFEKDKGPWLDTSPVPTFPVNEGYESNQPAGQVTFEWNEVIPANFGGILKYVVQYSTSSTFATATTLTATTDLFKTTTIAPSIGTTYYWRVKVQNPSGVDISSWSPTRVFFNRYKNINAGPTFVEEDLGWDVNPVRFFAASANTSLPANAYYRVWLSRDGFNSDFFAWVFPKTANLATPSVRQFPNSLPSGTYAWKIEIANGNDGWAPWISGWTDGVGTIVVP
jgi:hypothetical protein